MRLYIPVLSTAVDEYNIGFGFVAGGSLKDGSATQHFSVIYDRNISTNWVVQKDGVNNTTSTTNSNSTVYC